MNFYIIYFGNIYIILEKGRKGVLFVNYNKAELKLISIGFNTTRFENFTLRC